MQENDTVTFGCMVSHACTYAWCFFLLLLTCFMFYCLMITVVEQIRPAMMDIL